MRGFTRPLLPAAATALVAAAGLWSTAALTDGLRAFTSESARRLAIESAPQPLPAIAWQGHAAPLAPGVVRVVDFIYTRCPSICQAQGGVQARLQAELAAPIARGEVELLSIGFDLAHDTPAALRAHRERHGAVAGWHAAAPAEAQSLATIATAFGITIVADGAGGFVHNAALHVVDAQGRLVGVLDIDDWRGAAARVRQLLGPLDATADASPDVGLDGRLDVPHPRDIAGAVQR